MDLICYFLLLKSLNVNICKSFMMSFLSFSSWPGANLLFLIFINFSFASSFTPPGVWFICCSGSCGHQVAMSQLAQVALNGLTQPICLTTLQVTCENSWLFSTFLGLCNLGETVNYLFGLYRTGDSLTRTPQIFWTEVVLIYLNCFPLGALLIYSDLVFRRRHISWILLILTFITS